MSYTAFHFLKRYYGFGIFMFISFNFLWLFNDNCLGFFVLFIERILFHANPHFKKFFYIILDYTRYNLVYTRLYIFYIILDLLLLYCSLFRACFVPGIVDWKENAHDSWPQESMTEGKQKNKYNIRAWIHIQ